ncbi:MAG: hypothetical protein ACOCWB_06710, partial [Bacteroidota bacterium]
FYDAIVLSFNNAVLNIFNFLRAAKFCCKIKAFSYKINTFGLFWIHNIFTHETSIAFLFSLFRVTIIE